MIEGLQLQIDKSKLKEILILFPAHREGLTSYLSPILGQHAIKNIDFLNMFVEEFNKKTNNLFSGFFNNEKIEENGLLNFDLIVPLKLKVYKAGKFSLVIKYPHITYLQKLYFYKKKRIFKIKRLKYSRRTIVLTYYNSKKILQLVLFRYLNLTNLQNLTLKQQLLYIEKYKLLFLSQQGIIKNFYTTIRDRIKVKRI